ncbi:autophagy protein [Cyclospora cayetanensis]|uniref:Autophagy-related protein 9 n=1 Tax=Cyclospora cayetanensis TaxID=88456 RepID=A0A1D3DAA3_9EIME|nr:autophagy protein [Cyclospora cayetanensis]
MGGPRGTRGVRNIELSVPLGGPHPEENPVAGFSGRNGFEAPLMKGPQRYPQDDSEQSDFHSGPSFDTHNDMESGVQQLRNSHSTMPVAFGRLAGNLRRFLMRCVGSRAPPELVRPLLSSRRWGYVAAAAPSHSFAAPNVQGICGPPEGSSRISVGPGGPRSSRGELQGSGDSPERDSPAFSGLRGRREAGDGIPCHFEGDGTAEDRDLASWDAVPDLDRFVGGIYTYWAEGGLYAMLCSYGAHLMVMGFTVYFSWFLLMFVNWEVKQNLSVLDLVAVIMRRDNYIIALTNKEVFARALPVYVNPKLLYTRVLLWSIRRAVFLDLFDAKQRINRQLLTQMPPYGSRYRTAAGHYLAQRQSQLSLSSREFTGLAFWGLREYNELPHQLVIRLALAGQAADAYLSLHPKNPSLYRLKLTAKYITGALLAVCLLLYICEDTAFLMGKVGGRGLLGITFALGLLYAALSQGGPRNRANASDLQPHISRNGLGNSVEEEASGVAVGASLFLGCESAQHGAFHSVSEQHRRAMCDLCSSLYSLRVTCMLDELAAVLLAPLLLCFYLPSAADDIWECIYASTVSTPLGDLCCFSGLDVAAYGSSDYAPPHRFLQQKQHKQQQSCQTQLERQGHDSQQHLPLQHDSERRERSEEEEEEEEKTPPRGVSVSLLPSEDDEGAAGWTARSRSHHRFLGIGSLDAPCEAPRWRHLAPTVTGARGGPPYIPLLQRFMPSNGKLEKSALSFLLTYRIAAPHDDTSPLWSVLASRKITRALMAASAKNVGTHGAPCVSGGGSSSALASMVPATSYYSGGTAIKPMIHWGAPPSAVALLAGLEAFQEHLLQQQPYLMQELPASLTQLKRGVPGAPNGGAVGAFASYGNTPWGPMHAACGPRPITDEEKGAYYFWLEKLYEFNSGRVLFATNQLNFFTRALFKQTLAPRSRNTRRHDGGLGDLRAPGHPSVKTLEQFAELPTARPVPDSGCGRASSAAAKPHQHVEESYAGAQESWNYRAAAEQQPRQRQRREASNVLPNTCRPSEAWREEASADISSASKQGDFSDDTDGRGFQGPLQA